ncbi:hypothetical protein CLOP_g14567 [Closterium sp. NIES-67]|nr:hypothetical protein CLOP_g14567 [Closterium sp. NIES-67]
MRKDSKGRNWRLRLTVTTSRIVTEAAIESLCDSINRSLQGFNCLNFRCTTPSLKSLQLGLSLCKRS